MTIKHSKLGASSSERWINCPASVKVLEGIKKDESSQYAAEGTAAHSLAEKCLTSDSNAIDYIGETIEGFTVCFEMAGFVQNYIDYVRAVKGDGDLLVEQRVDFSKYVYEGFGTADAIVIDAKNKHLHVIDLKFGRGVAVYAENNTQGQLYALGACLNLSHRHKFDNITIHIHQPRIGNMSQWTISKAQLKEFALFVRERSKIALSDNAPFNPTEKGCMWCGAKPTCAALAKQSFDLVTTDFGNLTVEPTPPPIESLTPEQIAQILPNLPLLESWIKSVKEHAFTLAENNQLTGYKLVAGRNSRKWASDEESISDALNALGITPFKTELLSVAQAEKLITKEQKADFSKLYTSIVGAATVALITDKRPALRNVVDDFESV